LSDFKYLVLACHIKNDKLIIESEWCGSERITLTELEENLDLDELNGIIIICDQLPSQDALKDVNIPIMFVPDLSSGEKLKNLWFQLFKKQSFLTFKDNCMLWNISRFNLGEKVKLLNGQFKSNVIKLPAEISKDEVAKFIGRSQDIEEVSRKLFESKIQNECLTILGAGGLGKTSLVKKLAYEYNERGLFDGGVTFIDCENLTSYQQFHRHIAGAFELEDAIDVIEHICENPEFQQGERLIIVDNAESLLLLNDKRKILSLIGEISGLATLIVTSRESLNIPSESVYQLRDFVAEEAFQLFESKAKRQFSEADRQFLKEHILKEYLDHNPLAISLIASALVKGKNLNKLREDLKTNFFIMENDQENIILPEDRNIDRRSSIYNSIDYSYKMLAEQSKEALIKLSYFPDGIDLESFKKLTEKDAKIRDKTPIKEVTIKALQDKSLVQTSLQFIRLHPLVARFAKSKVNLEDEISYLKVIFNFQLNFLKALNSMVFDYNLNKQLVAKRIANKHVNNFCLILERLTPDFNENDIINYVSAISRVLANLDIFQEPHDSLKKSLCHFENNDALYKYLVIRLLGGEYYLGGFDSAFSKILKILPPEEWLALDYKIHIEQVTFDAASIIYSNEGMAMDAVIYHKNYNIRFIAYPSELSQIGLFNHKLVEVCRQDVDSIYVKWASGKLTIQELNIIFEHIHPKAHIQIAAILVLKAKLAPLSKDEISKLVVVNPYTQGVKYLLNAIHSENIDEAKGLFMQALPELQHIKFAYTEALLEYAKWLQAQEDSDFKNIYIEGLTSAKKYHYRFLQHSFLQLKSDTKIPYNEADYSLPNEQDFNDYVNKLIKYCKS
jgi:predicted ATPase